MVIQNVSLDSIVDGFKKPLSECGELVGRTVKKGCEFLSDNVELFLKKGHELIKGKGDYKTATGVVLFGVGFCQTLRKGNRLLGIFLMAAGILTLRKC